MYITRKLQKVDDTFYDLRHATYFLVFCGGTFSASLSSKRSKAVFCTLQRQEIWLLKQRVNPRYQRCSVSYLPCSVVLKYCLTLHIRAHADTVFNVCFGEHCTTNGPFWSFHRRPVVLASVTLLAGAKVTL